MFRARGLSGKQILLVSDFDTLSTPDRLVKFITRVHQRTGVYPVTHLENSSGLRERLIHVAIRQGRLGKRSLQREALRHLLMEQLAFPEDLAQPIVRYVFKSDEEGLRAFWERQSIVP